MVVPSEVVKLDTHVKIYVKMTFIVIVKCLIVCVIVSVKENKEIKVKKNIKKISA